MSLSTKNTGSVVIAAFPNDRIIDELLIQKLGEEMIQLIQQEQYKHVIINFQTVEFMSSAMLGKLNLLNKKSREAGKTLQFCCINDNLMEVFRITNLDRVFTIVATEEDAVKAAEAAG